MVHDCAAGVVTLLQHCMLRVFFKPSDKKTPFCSPQSHSSLAWFFLDFPNRSSFSASPNMDYYTKLQGGPAATVGMERQSNAVQQGNLADSPSYHALLEAGLLTSRYRVRTPSDLDLWPANSQPTWNCLASTFRCCTGCCVVHTEVDSGSIGLLEDGRGGFAFLGPGLHCYCSGFYSTKTNESLLSRDIINGDRGIITVQQGKWQESYHTTQLQLFKYSCQITLSRLHRGM